jgi:3-methyladenine DNA glycosylase AlkD
MNPGSSSFRQGHGSARKLIAGLRSALRAHADPGRAVRGRAYMKSAMPMYGVNAATLRRIARQVFRQFPLADFRHWHDTVQALWRGARYREERLCAILLCDEPGYRCHQTMQALPLYEEMIATGAWWDLVDPIAAHQVAFLLKHYPKQMDPILRRWSRSDNIWKRRAAILSQLRRGAGTDLTLLYRCIEPSLGSDEFFLQKAIGWALRDYAWHDMAEIKRYVKEHQDRLSSLSRREALKHLAR